ncbi:toll/interleukin-1 receptor domain-containing protein [Sodalis sp. dw_96]|uniref:toll/interleukin-1 receptor domain-containing protein n=1 Tax=Sodalis sp. dw_96 TaxID=2719794 RepID=UPI001BD4BCE8|nr:toll/interleukin-1 receptor domain-containing protein [Sodalis sp. dw_96]
MSKQIFISHAVSNKALADAFVDLLQTGVNLAYDDVFCSSLEGLGISAGDNFIDHIKGQIQSPKLVVAIISKNYLASQFCMCELGAAWAMSHKLLPLLVPPLKYADVQGVLKASQLVRIDDENALSQFANDLKDIVPSVKVSIPRWNVKSKKFIQHLPDRISECGAPSIIPIEEYEALKKELSETKAALAEIDDDNEKLSILVKELEQCKDQSEVRAVKKRHSSEKDEFDELIRIAVAQLMELPRVVSLVMCKAFGSGESTYLDPFKDKDTRDEADEAVGKQYLDVDNSCYSLNRQHPKIKKTIKMLENLDVFIDEISKEFVAAFEEENEFLLSLKNREFWEWALDKRLARLSV